VFAPANKKVLMDEEESLVLGFLASVVVT